MNGVRGEVSLVVDGRKHVLCLTLGALAEMETLFGCESMCDLQIRLKRLSASELMSVLCILLRAGGGAKCAEDGLARVVAPADAARAVAEAFRAALG
ncbi:MAG: GTA-gp10 family protein [Pseudomonadota bacterium]